MVRESDPLEIISEEVREGPPIIIEQPRVLKSYQEHQNELVLTREVLQSGIACTDKIRETRTRMRTKLVSREEIQTLEPFFDPKTKVLEERHSVVTVEDEVEVEEVYEEIVGDCPGEMVIPLPVVRHPQLKVLRDAHCDTCGWMGWV